MKVRNIILTIATALLVAVPLTLIAQGAPGGGNGPGPGGGAWGQGPHHGGSGGEAGDGLRFFERMLPRLAEELGVTDEQLAEIQTILDDAQPEIEYLTEQLSAGRETYREAHSDPTVFDETAFRTHATEQSQVQIDLMVLVQSTKARAFAVLTPEQLAQLEEMRGNIGKRGARRSGGRRSS